MQTNSPRRRAIAVAPDGWRAALALNRQIRRYGKIALALVCAFLIPGIFYCGYITRAWRDAEARAKLVAEKAAVFALVDGFKLHSAQHHREKVAMFRSWVAWMHVTYQTNRERFDSDPKLRDSLSNLFRQVDAVERELLNTPDLTALDVCSSICAEDGKPRDEVPATITTFPALDQFAVQVIELADQLFPPVPP